MLEDFIKAKAVKIKERVSKFKEIPKNLRANVLTESSVELSWTKPKGVRDDKVVSYQASVRKAGGGALLKKRRGAICDEREGDETHCEEPGDGREVRVLCVRCKFADGRRGSPSRKEGSLSRRSLHGRSALTVLLSG